MSDVLDSDMHSEEEIEKRLKERRRKNARKHLSSDEDDASCSLSRTRETSKSMKKRKISDKTADRILPALPQLVINSSDRSNGMFFII